MALLNMQNQNQKDIQFWHAFNCVGGFGPQAFKKLTAGFSNLEEAWESADAEKFEQLGLSKKQINTLMGLSESQGLTLVPLKLYGKRNKVKLLIGIARGKKKYDKREATKKKDLARSKQRGIEE